MENRNNAGTLTKLGFHGGAKHACRGWGRGRVAAGPHPSRSAAASRGKGRERGGLALDPAARRRSTASVGCARWTPCSSLRSAGGRGSASGRSKSTAEVADVTSLSSCTAATEVPPPPEASGASGRPLAVRTAVGMTGDGGAKP